MNFDTFDEGIMPGGIRSKNEIRVLICYMFNSIKDKLSKDIVIEAVLQYELANYFELSSAFDELVNNGNLVESGVIDGETVYVLSENGKMIAEELESAVPYSVKEKAYNCALKLLAEKKTKRENKVEIVKTENGYSVNCLISGGEIELLSFTLYAPDFEQAEIIKKNFYESPLTVYKVMLALMTKDKESVGEALEDVYGVLG